MPDAQNASGNATSTNIISDEQLRTYLATTNFDHTYFDGISFIAFERLGEIATSSRVTNYVWLMTQEYYKKDGDVQKGTGVSLPVAIIFDKNQPIAINAPRDGNMYSQDMIKIFPADIVATSSISDPAIHHDLIAKLETDIKTQAEKYFKTSIGGISPIKNPIATSTESTSTENILE